GRERIFSRYENPPRCPICQQPDTLKFFEEVFRVTLMKDGKPVLDDNLYREVKDDILYVRCVAEVCTPEGWWEGRYHTWKDALDFLTSPTAPQELRAKIAEERREAEARRQAYVERAEQQRAKREAKKTEKA